MASPFRTFEKNVTSQWGEDGVIAEIFNRIGTKSRYFIEFGAWDGKYLSNTWTLWNQSGWNGLLIEGEADREAALRASITAFPGVKTKCAFVRPEGPNALDTLVRDAGGPEQPDLLSIDIDGDEYHVLNHLKWLKPRVIVAEFNATIPPHIHFVQQPGAYMGASAHALTELMNGKGYELVHITSTNLFFVSKQDFPALNVPHATVAALFTGDHLVHVMSSYDGKLYLDNAFPYFNAIPDINTYAARLSFREKLYLLLGLKISHPFAHHHLESNPEFKPVAPLF